MQTAQQEQPTSQRAWSPAREGSLRQVSVNAQITAHVLYSPVDRALRKDSGTSLDAGHIRMTAQACARELFGAYLLAQSVTKHDSYWLSYLKETAHHIAVAWLTPEHGRLTAN